ncbi:probable amino acid permease 7 isoform X2 [Macadamia integrifolia]|uniref:probable amino acid permease 7 isoform X2 n=1 Tax=Macadamia integrifolia TaxID=60698 RepID=UPI001C5274AC|nr:probable amino acid permease 7 isoform X2 [Macadamia integrifolia]
MAVLPSIEPSNDSCDDNGLQIRTGTLRTGVAHIITAVIGSGVLSLAWSVAQLGWIAGPLSMFCFAVVTYVSSFLLSDCYRYPDPVTGARHHSYMEAVKTYLGRKQTWICGLLQFVNLYGVGVAYVITTSTSMRAIQRSDCFHKEGHRAPCAYGDNFYMLLFGAIQIACSQIPDFHNMELLSILAAVMSFSYSSIGFGLGFAKVIGNGMVKGSISGVHTSTTPQKVWKVTQALGDIAFAYPYSIILIEIQVYSQPVFAVVERWCAEKFPNNGFVNSFYTLRFSLLPVVRINLLRLCFRTCYVLSTTGIAIAFPYFNQVLGVLGALNFWPLTIYFPVEMYFIQKKIQPWTRRWIVFQSFSFVCLIVTLVTLVGSVEGIISAKLG